MKSVSVENVTRADILWRLHRRSLYFWCSFWLVIGIAIGSMVAK